MEKTVKLKSVIKRIIISIVVVLCMVIVLAVKKTKYEIIKDEYIIGLIILVVLVSAFSLLFKFKTFSEKVVYWYYQICDFFLMLVIAVLILELVFTFWFFPAEVDQASMTPTLYDGKKLIVNVTNKVERFDIIVVECDSEYNYGVMSEELFEMDKSAYLKTHTYKEFKEFYSEPLHDGSLLIKRVVGLPGDSIKFDANGYLYVNGEYVDEVFLKDENGNFMSGICSETGDFYDTKTSMFSYDSIPEDYYFIMGDNRGNSSDSRSLGLFHKSQIIGKVKYQFAGFLNLKKV